MVRTSEQTAELGFIQKLNGPWHERALWIYLAIVVLHWIEHLFQAAQIWILEMPRPEALGALGYVFPWLVKSEVDALRVRPDHVHRPGAPAPRVPRRRPAAGGWPPRSSRAGTWSSTPRCRSRRSSGPTCSGHRYRPASSNPSSPAPSCTWSTT